MTEFLKDVLQTFDEACVILDGLDSVRDNERTSMVEAVHGIMARFRVIVASCYLQDKVFLKPLRNAGCKSCHKESNEAKSHWQSRDCT